MPKLEREAAHDAWKAKIVEIRDRAHEVSEKARSGENPETTKFDLKSSSYLAYSLVCSLAIQLDVFLATEEEELPHFIHVLESSLTFIEALLLQIEEKIAGKE
ncbi:hypothetical protein C5B42_04610 [Candidatus Cerribacteria bacterium 'Amazon FNV 2010 28 9']|uniref:HEPN domain-containing protein n=1 Tax=Candidatus Cerribacteria bacterium 'Amazon FNV 2010 28 9' TaxID=2081795 RepID=A0A317JQI1_9BACT|nr:MAG: hypothetical protein C5B42_04610 [Candidatus Cerribacteria bacterium 'Amazon FNV 2010 28 9']